MKCSLAPCDADAVVSWQRHAGPDEANPVVDTEERQRLMFEQRRHTQRQIIREFEAMRDDPEFDPSQLRNVERQITAETALLEAMVYEPMPPRTRPTLIAVYACADHSINRDEAARIHEAGCLSAGPCACLTDQNPNAHAPDYDINAIEAVDWFKD